ncbi:hypothetical protein NC652_030333 [Populus alba x Populus x berolinensis]|nr:hypothetical protein NC652_030333 [Populus alba x Populus x berolinensis]
MGGIGVISAQDDDAAAAASTSFKLKRKSAVASKLKSSISIHLRHSYSHDHVLAEYITVLVCNGKNQEQARHDLEAFLGQRTQEFVSWLWDLLLKYVHQSNKDICLLSDAKNVNITTPCAKDSKINKLKDFQSHGHDSSTMDVFVIKDDQMRQLPTTSDPNFLLSRPCKTERHGKIGASENVLYNSLANESLRKESSSNSKQNSQCIDKATKQIVHSSCNMLFNQLIPRREPAFRNPQPSTSGKCPLPRSVHAESHQKEKHRISVWDRWGKPCDDVPSGVKTVELCDGLGTVIQKQELLNQHKAVLPVLNSELRGSMTGVTGRGNIQPESRKLERSTRMMHEAHAANNIR